MFVMLSGSPCVTSCCRWRRLPTDMGGRCTYMVFKEQSQATNNEWYSNLWVGQGAKTPHHKNTYTTKYYTERWVWAGYKSEIYFCVT